MRQSWGLAQKTGIDLPDEAAGMMPSEAWKLKTQHDKWYAGETISVGIGQGAIEATPMQLARALSGIASGGVLRAAACGVAGADSEASSRRRSSRTFPGSGEATDSDYAGELADRSRMRWRTC